MGRPEGWTAVRRRLASIGPLAAVVVLATAVFALAGIGSPLLGLRVFADTGSLADYSGYRDVLAGVLPQHHYLRDQIDSGMPNSILFGEALRAGEFAAWNPYALGGAPLGSNPNFAVASPISLPYWFLPGWLAPAYVKLLELICAIGGGVLFLRRLGLGRPAAWLGALVFASSAFMVAWTGWPQTRVACLIPALFYTLERLLQRPAVREAALVSLPVAGMLLGGFPAVTGYALLTAAGYVLVRVFATHRRHWAPALRALVLAGTGVVAGVGLVAWQLVPWVRYMQTVFLTGRDQDPSQHIPFDALLTAIAPYAFGTTNPAHPPLWFGSLELVDAQSYVGSAAVVLIIASLALARASRAVLPRGVWVFFVAASALWLVAIYLGGPLLGLLQDLSVLFSANFVGRARSVLGFLFAVLAAVGFETVLRGRPARVPDWASRVYGVAIWLAAAGVGVILYRAGRALAENGPLRRGPGPDYLGFFNQQVAAGLVLVGAAAVAVAWLWWRPRPWVAARAVAAALLPVLAAGQALWWVSTYHPRTEKKNFYPSTPTQEYLAAHLGHERYFGADPAIFGSVDVTARLRSFHGHSFIDYRYAELADTLPGQQFQVPTTAIMSRPQYASAVAVSPLLDRAAVSHFVVPPQVAPFGDAVVVAGDGELVLTPGRTYTAPLPVSGPVRGVGVMPLTLPEDARTAGTVRAHLVVRLRDTSGRVVATGERIDRPQDLGAEAGHPWFVPLAAEDVPAGTSLIAELTAVEVPLRVAALGNVPAVSVVTPVDDGLRLVYARETVIYERTRALPRARWASSAVVETDRDARVRLVTSGELRKDQVVLSSPGAPAQGRPATVEWIEDGLDEMVLSVAAEGAGYLVLADALQTGWRVTVDGVEATLVPADHAFVAVAVPAGRHTVRFYYPEPFSGPGLWITVVTALVVIAALAWRPAVAFARTLAHRAPRGRTIPPEVPREIPR